MKPWRDEEQFMRAVGAIAGPSLLAVVLGLATVSSAIASDDGSALNGT